MKKIRIFIKTPLKFVPRGQIDNRHQAITWPDDANVYDAIWCHKASMS